LRQTDRKPTSLYHYCLHTLSALYKIRHNGASRIFSRKPGKEIFRSSYQCASEEAIADIRFVNDDSLPWRPKALFIHNNPGSQDGSTMEAHNITNWTVTIQDIICTWSLKSMPISLVLRERTTDLIIACFI
ncbi:hypothetical protein BS50DRAFT_659133, partial [Corynespora cassiicola Philippines]